MSDTTPDQITNILNEAVDEISENTDPKSLSLESLALLINADRLKTLENNITKEFVELKARQDKVSTLYKVIKAVNSATVDDAFDCTNDTDLQALLQKAKEYGADIKPEKLTYNRQERDRLIENIKITADELNVLNDMQLQTISRLTTERYESYQLARSIMKPLHEDKVNKARAIAGR